MKKNLLTFCMFFCIAVSSLSAQITERGCSQLREINGKMYGSSGKTSVVCQGHFGIWTCRKCGTSNVNEAKRCSSCGASR